MDRPLSGPCCPPPTVCLDWVTPSPCVHPLPSLLSPCHLLPRGGPSELICGQNQALALGPLCWGSSLSWADASGPSWMQPLSHWALAPPTLHNPPMSHCGHHTICSAADMAHEASFCFVPYSKQQGTSGEQHTLVPTPGTLELVSCPPSVPESHSFTSTALDVTSVEGTQAPHISEG